MRHAGHHDLPDEHDLGIEATQIFPALGPEYERPSRNSAGQAPVMRPAWDQGRPAPPPRMRLNHWVIAAGSITAAVAAYVAFATAGVPARPMPSPFAPAATTQLSPGGATPRTPRGVSDGKANISDTQGASRGAAASQASRLPANCATPLAGAAFLWMSPLGSLGRGAAAAAPAAAAGPQVVQQLAR
jgi:hypothetical protein